MDSNGLEHIKGKAIVEKANLVRIEISQLPKKLPEFKKSRATKDILIASWLENLIKTDLASGKIKPKQLLPKKQNWGTFMLRVHAYSWKGLGQSSRRS